ncbi:hypothetical protein [Paenibacillus tuaregi]|uniref:hypothetical protein n=1 Tax=Paenibacillus tuaregi TaxID=1816681 RepID=UPI000839805C|nr:hypothetical protein [Paenibacillus tuaregi]
MKMSKFTRWLMAAPLISALAFPTISAAAPQKAVSDVCTFEVPTYDLVVSKDAKKNSTSIAYTCQTGILSIDVSSKAEDSSVVKTEDGFGHIDVTALKPGSTDVLVSVYGYGEPARIKFNVAAESDQGTETPETPAVQEDPAIQQLQDYIGQMKKLVNYENTAVNTYNKYQYVSSKNRKEAYYAFANTIVPNYTKFVAGIKAMKTPNADLKRINALYIKGSSYQLEALTLMKKALYNTKIDSKLYKQANAKLAEGRKLISQFSSEFEKYTNKLLQ